MSMLGERPTLELALGTKRGPEGPSIVQGSPAEDHPFKKRTTRLFLPTDWSSIGASEGVKAATWTLSVERERSFSNSSCRKEVI